jgi:Holliday junction resolvase RusA-like endonuclease
MTIVVHGEPVAQGRPRFNPKTCKAVDPAKSKDFKTYLAYAAAVQMNGQPPLKGPLVLSVRVYRSMLKSFSKKKAEEAETGAIRPETKPDLSNYIKGIEDALNGIVWTDDSQIVAYKEPFGKYYSNMPRVEIDVEPFGAGGGE